MAIDVAAQVHYWSQGSTDDLDAAHTLLAAAKTRHAGFFVHLAIEKAIKARVVAATRDVPPHSHDLLLLAQRAGINLSQEQRDFLGRVQVYCMEGRYPDQLPPPPAAQVVARDLNDAEEIVRWLIDQLSNP
ncbi:MAG TPA: HEPN domain-containing protein [Phycisphaerae bacterium]|nr:HEPN domain-containing protein [Phycisphaerae bacterium]